MKCKSDGDRYFSLIGEGTCYSCRIRHFFSEPQSWCFGVLDHRDMTLTNLIHVYVNDVHVLVTRILMTRWYHVGERARTKESLRLALPNSVNSSDLFKLAPCL